MKTVKEKRGETEEGGSGKPEEDTPLPKASKSKVETKEAHVKEVNSKGSKQKGNSKAGPTSRDSASDTNVKKDSLFTKFEILQYPILDSQISCRQLRELTSLVELKNCSMASYFTQSSAWENLEPTVRDPRTPKTDPSGYHKPVTATFDEIWAPLPADVEDSDNIIPPTFTYLTSGNNILKQTLPTLVTSLVRKEHIPGYYQ